MTMTNNCPVDGPIACDKTNCCGRCYLHDCGNFTVNYLLIAAKRECNAYWCCENVVAYYNVNCNFSFKLELKVVYCVF